MRVLVALIAPALLLAACGSERHASAPCPREHWVSAWMGAPTDAINDGFEQQTIRMVVTPTFRGEWARIRLSNRLGRRRVTLDHVTVGRRGSGARVVPGTLRTVRFGGRRAVSIPSGAEAASDAVPLELAPFRDIVVSVYAQASTGRATEHRPATPASYVTAPGTPDAAADLSDRAFTRRLRSWSFLVGVDVAAPRSAGAVVAIGDSLTEGGKLHDRGEKHQAYPDLLASRVLDDSGLPGLAIVNAGVIGNVLLHAPSGLGMVDRLGPDVLGQPGVRGAIVLGGTNDIFRPPSPPASELIDALAAVVARLNLHGVRAVLGTIPPRGRFGSRIRAEVNRWIRTPGVADGIADFDAVLAAAPGSDRMAPEYDRGDHIHPNAAGYAAMARAVNPTQLIGSGCQADRDREEELVRIRL
jgi:lysophospholipase L1-like esterase